MRLIVCCCYLFRLFVCFHCTWNSIFWATTFLSKPPEPFFSPLSYSHISSPPVPFLLLSCSFISSPARVFWPHNLIFSLQSVYVYLLSPCSLSLILSLSFLLYFHLWALSLHPLSPSSPPILICSSLWRKGERGREFFTASSLPGESVGGASLQVVVHPGIVESKRAQAGGVWDQELLRCRRREGTTLCVGKVSFFFCASLQVLPLLLEDVRSEVL